MSLWQTVLLSVHVLAAVGVIALVLLQQGKGAEMGAAFGSGSSGSLFGSTGSANFLSRTTSLLAVVFFLTSLGLAYMATQRPASSGSVMDAVPVPSTVAPANDNDVPRPSDVPQPGVPEGVETPADRIPD